MMAHEQPGPAVTSITTFIRIENIRSWYQKLTQLLPSCAARNRSHNDKWHIWKCKSKFNNRFALYSAPFTYFVTEGRTNIYRYVYLIELIYQEKYFSKNCFAMIDVNSVMLCYQLLTRRLTHFSLWCPAAVSFTLYSNVSVWHECMVWWCWKSGLYMCSIVCWPHPGLCMNVNYHKRALLFWGTMKSRSVRRRYTHTQTHAPLIHGLGTPAPLTPPVHHQMASVLTRDFS